MKQVYVKWMMCVLLMLAAMQTNAQVREFEKFSGAKDITYAYVSSYMLNASGLKGAPSLPGIDSQAMVKKLECMQVLSSETKAGSAKLKTATMNYVKAGKNELIMQMNDGGQKVNIYNCTGRKQSAVVMLVEEGNEAHVIAFVGKFTAKDIAAMRKK